MDFKNLELGLLDYATNAIKWARVNLKMKGFGGQKANRRKENTGKLGKGLFAKLTSGKDGVRVRFLSKENYGYNVEYGRKKGSMPPAQPINLWMTQKKGLKGIRDKQGRFVSRKQSLFLIRRKIMREGIKAVPFMRVAAEEELKKAENKQNLEEALVFDMQESMVTNANSTGVKATIK